MARIKKDLRYLPAVVAVATMLACPMFVAVIAAEMLVGDARMFTVISMVSMVIKPLAVAAGLIAGVWCVGALVEFGSRASTATKGASAPAMLACFCALGLNFSAVLTTLGMVTRPLAAVAGLAIGIWCLKALLAPENRAGRVPRTAAVPVMLGGFGALGVILVDELSNVATALSAASPYSLPVNVLAVMAGLLAGWLSLRTLLAPDGEAAVSRMVQGLAETPLFGRYIAWSRMRSLTRRLRKGIGPAAPPRLPRAR